MFGLVVKWLSGQPVDNHKLANREYGFFAARINII